MNKSPYILGKMRHVSWSAISSYEWSPEQWYNSYYLGIRTDSKEMEFGRKVDKEIERNPKYLPQIVRYKIMQHRMDCVFNGLPLVGVSDTYKPTKRCALRDYKTGKKAWDQKRADETGQLTMYALLLNLIDGVKPEDLDLYIDWMPTKETNDFKIRFRDQPMVLQTFQTKRTMRDLLEFGQRINKRWKEMNEYVKSKDK